MSTDLNSLQATRKAHTVLFVDDEPHACKWFARLFADEFSIITASNVDEALQTLRERAPDVAVLVTDYRMPLKNGLELLTAVQRDHRHVVRLLATAYAEKDVAVAAINQGRVLQILEKPFDEAQVRSVLREALDAFVQREREQALSESRAAAMRETLGFLAHELNTPLATVLGYMEALKGRYLPPAQDAPPGVAGMTEKRPGDALTMIEAAERRTAYAMSLVATFVQSARDAYPGSAPAKLQASRLVSTLLRDYPFENDEHTWVSCDLRGDFELPGQRDLLYLVLCTLTKNAMLALRGRDQPRLHITLESMADAPAGVPAGAPVGGHNAAIRFTDNGPGIPPEILSRLTFEPVTTRAHQGGSGMGLMFCRRVVQSMGGQIAVHSGPGPGASVTLLFKPEPPPERTEP
jgi:two-component system, response regulator PhcR